MACLSGAGVASALALAGERDESVPMLDNKRATPLRVVVAKAVLAVMGGVALAPGVRQPPLRTAETVFVVEADHKPRDLGAMCVVKVLLSSRVADAGSTPTLDGAGYAGYAGATV